MIHALLLLCTGIMPGASTDPPRLGELPAIQPIAPPAPKPDEPRPLAADRFRLFWVEQYSGTVPLRWSVTPLDPNAALDVIELLAGAPAIGILEGESRAKAHFAPTAATNAVAVWGVTAGRVLLQADGVQEGRIVTLVSCDCGGQWNSHATESPPRQPSTNSHSIALFPDRSAERTCHAGLRECSCQSGVG